MTSRQEELRQWAEAYIHQPPETDDDKEQRRSRWTGVCKMALASGSGDIVEIGALAGDSTVRFCALAEQFKRKVLVIDPWPAPTHNVAGWEHAKFLERTAKWLDNDTLAVWKEKSQELSIVEAVVRRNIAFALVDGSHKYADVLCDLMSVRNARVICEDDMNMSGVRKAFNRALALMPGREGLLAEGFGRKWEGYIV